MLGPRPVPCDLAAAGLRLMLVDTRGPPRPAAAASRGFAGHGLQRAVMWAGLPAGALGGRAVTDGPGRPVCLLVPVGRVAAVRAEILAEFAPQRRPGAALPHLHHGPRPGPASATLTSQRHCDQPAPL